MGYALRCKGRQVLLWICQLLSAVHSSVCRSSPPIDKVTKKGCGLQGGPYQKEAFCKLKQKLCEAPILQFPDPKLPYTVVTDASGAAVGGVLMQDQGEGLQPLACMSKALKPLARRYSAYEHELAAVAYCFLQWRHHLEGCPGGVNAIIDHQPLTLLMQ